MTTYSILKKYIPKILENPSLVKYFEERSLRLTDELTELSKSGGLTDQDFHRIKLLSDERTTAFNLDAIGMHKDIIEVREAPFAHPRAYITYPRIYIDEQGKRIDSSEIWVDVPTGYNLQGDSIRPSVPFRLIQDEIANETLKNAFESKKKS